MIAGMFILHPVLFHALNYCTDTIVQKNNYILFCTQEKQFQSIYKNSNNLCMCKSTNQGTAFM